MKYLIKIQQAGAEGAPLEYLRAFDSEDLSLPIRAIDDALNKKPRKPRSDAGKPREVAK